MHIWKASFKHAGIHEKRFIAALTADPDVLVAQQNHFLARRRAPNDPLIASQWPWINLGSNGIADADIDADEAWDISTGGVTALGDTIVVASIDVGVDYMHPDLAQNIWMNRNEIAGNRVDDDGNGYIDDVRGWNVLLENDNIEPELFGGGVQESHGTEILGVIGAVGNNRVGISGLNWDIKMMNVFFNSDLNEAEMIAAYGYILSQRKLYNETRGAKGAFVVATNLSYGEEKLSPEDAPIWCAVYDSLGAQGILNCIATSNNELNLDIDSITDVPSSCASDYMLAITATNESDQRSFAAFGKNDIDLAAPGVDIFTTSIPGYVFERGTSYSAPMVAAAIGLLYSSPCGDLAALASIDPAAAAMMARTNVMESVDKTSQLENEVLSGGRLNAFRSLQSSIEVCETCVAPFGTEINSLADSSVITWSLADSVSSVNLSWRMMGDTVWQQLENAQSPVILSALASCSDYEYQLEATCLDSTTAVASSSFTTLCCDAPADILVNILSSSSAAVEWDTILAADQYLVRWTKDGAFSWDTVLTATPNIELDNLSACTAYRLQVQSFCFESEVTLSDTVAFTTMGCGACLDSVYCVPPVEVAGEEWIEQITLHTLTNKSGSSDGYADFTGGEAPILLQGQSYTLEVVPGFVDTSMEESVFAWIDYDHNGDFDNGEELIFASEAGDTAIQSGNIVIPLKSTEGLTRLRVVLVYDPPEDFTACSSVDFGEIEDYCVHLRFDSLLCPLPTNVDTTNFAGTSTDITWERVDSAIAYTIRYRKVGEEEWEEAADTAIVYSLGGLDECSDYEVQVQAVCAFDTSGYTESFVFSTFCSTQTDEVPSIVSISAYPNPFGNRLAVRLWSGDRISGKIELFGIYGQKLWARDLPPFSGHHGVEVGGVDDLVPGTYILRFEHRGKSIVKRIVKH